MIATKSNPINPTDAPLNGPGEDDIPAIVALLFFAHRYFTADTTLERHGLGRIRLGVVFLAGRGSRPSANKLPTTLKLETQNPKRARARPAREALTRIGTSRTADATGLLDRWGTGLGEPIARRGWSASAPRGTKDIERFPNLAGQPEPMMEDSPHILVIDDDDRLRSLLKKFLTENDFVVITAKDAGNGRERLKSIDVDLIVLDLMMPGESGLAFAEKLRGFLDSHFNVDRHERSRGSDRRPRKGADDYLTKPFEPRELLLRIHSILRRQPNSQWREQPAPSLSAAKHTTWSARNLPR